MTKRGSISPWGMRFVMRTGGAVTVVITVVITVVVTVVIAAPLAATLGCTGARGGSAPSGSAPSGGRHPSEPHASELLHVSYDPTRELYEAYDSLFAVHWKTTTGERFWAAVASGARTPRSGGGESHEPMHGWEWRR